MEMLRERLAQKLGVVKSPDPTNPNLVRVETKSTEPALKENAREPAPRRVVHRPAAPATTAALAPTEAGHGPAHSPHWDYAGSGSPASWAQLNPEFAKCGNGTRQSPIDIRDGIKVELDPVQFSYQPSAFRVIDNGHTVQVNVAPGNFIEVGGRRFELLQFHFHRPSEERVDGKQYDMVVHLVHKDADGHLAVVAVLLESGSAQPIVQSVWNNLPLEKGEEVAARINLDPGALLPRERGYFTYMGSLTTPPCSEGVLWMVMKQPVPISPEQIGIFARLYPMNARPVQPMGDRLIKESN
jgi:carbonic anhydrase